MNELGSLSEGLNLLAPEKGQYATAANKDQTMHVDIIKLFYKLNLSILFRTLQLPSLYKTMAYYACTCLIPPANLKQTKDMLKHLT